MNYNSIIIPQTIGALVLGIIAYLGLIVSSMCYVHVMLTEVVFIFGRLWIFRSPDFFFSSLILLFFPYMWLPYFNWIPEPFYGAKRRMHHHRCKSRLTNVIVNEVNVPCSFIKYSRGLSFWGSISFTVRKICIPLSDERR